MCSRLPLLALAVGQASICGLAMTVCEKRSNVHDMVALLIIVQARDPADSTWRFGRRLADRSLRGRFERRVISDGHGAPVPS